MEDVDVVVSDTVDAVDTIDAVDVSDTVDTIDVVDTSDASGTVSTMSLDASQYDTLITSLNDTYVAIDILVSLVVWSIICFVSYGVLKHFRRWFIRQFMSWY